jgi:hypothetical protein
MKKLSLMAIAAIAALFQACEKDQYHDLDKSTHFNFNIGDTLIYQSNQAEDTFCVTNKVFYYVQENHESHDYYQLCDVVIQKVPIDIQNLKSGEMPIPVDDYIYLLKGGYGTEIKWSYFDESASRFNDSIITYTIGSHQISDVHVLISKDDANQVVYYHYNNGIIAYNFGELFEIKERYLDVK